VNVALHQAALTVDQENVNMFHAGQTQERKKESEKREREREREREEEGSACHDPGYPRREEGR